MPETLEQRTRETLRNYLREVKSLPNESAKRSRFASLIGELFLGTNAVTEYARGVEKLIRIEQPDRRKEGTRRCLLRQRDRRIREESLCHPDRSTGTTPRLCSGRMAEGKGASSPALGNRLRWHYLENLSSCPARWRGADSKNRHTGRTSRLQSRRRYTRSILAVAHEPSLPTAANRANGGPLSVGLRRMESALPPRHGFPSLV